MSQELEIGKNWDINRINHCLSNKYFKKLSEYLKSTFQLQRDCNDTPLVFSFSVDIMDSLLNILKVVPSLEYGIERDALARQLFCALRNYVINPEVQSYLCQNPEFIDKVYLLLKTDNSNEYIKFLLQFLVNLSVSNKTACSIIHKECHSKLLHLLQIHICIHEVSALLYNISLHQTISCQGIELYTSVFDAYDTHHKVEFLHFLLETFVTYDNFWYHYGFYNVNQRIIILEIVKDDQLKERRIKVPQLALEVLTKQFCKSSEVIFQTIASGTSDPEPYEISLLVEVLSSFCGDERHLTILQQNKDFIIHAGILLINIHRLGKQSKNYFSSVQKLSEIREPNEVIKHHPTFGFKLSLVRIIGNLCWKNAAVQNLVREAELIPVLLDCCNIDARNPFIMQWVILAVRNLCENNQDNQAFIKGLNREGTVSSSVLEEMGLTLHSDEDNSIKIIPLESLRSKD